MTYHTPKQPSEETLARFRRDFFVRDGELYKYFHNNELRYFKITKKDTHGYLHVQISMDGKMKNFRAHHIIFYLEKGCWPAQQLDHEDRKRTNNNLNNLREVDPSISCINRSMSDRSLPPGVVYVKRAKPYLARFRGKHLGSFSNPYDAWLAYCKAYEDHYGKLPSVPNYLPIKVFNTAELDK